MEQLKELLKKIGNKSLFDEFFAKLEILSHNEICVFGMGNYGTQVLPILKKKLGDKILYVSDNDPNKHGKEYCGIKCVPPHKLDQNVHIFVSVFQAENIIADLSVRGFHIINSELPSNLNLYELIRFKQSGKLYNENYDKLETVFSLLSDELSKQVFMSRIQYNILLYKNIKIFDTVYSKNQYFPDDIIALKSNETFIDGGGYTGDTIRDFLVRTKNNFDSIYSFELDLQNYIAMNEYVKKLPKNHSQKIFIYPQGLSNQAEKVGLTGNKANTHISESGVFFDSFGELVALDEVIKNRSAVTFIKLDVEGSELNALIGMTQTIKESNPKMAVCIYHKPEDVYEIPLFLHKINPTYRFFLRHHGRDWFYANETVLYAIPEENI